MQTLSQDDYHALIHKQTALPRYAGRQIRLASFYVRMQGGRPLKAVNAAYSLLDFDKTGHAAPHRGKFSEEQNRAFYEAVRSSPFDDVDYDPQVQQLRRQMYDEFAWAPSGKAQRMMLDSIFSQGNS